MAANPYHFVASVVLCAALLACGSGEGGGSAPADGAAGAPAAQGKPTAPPSSPDSKVTEKGAMSDSFPADFPVFPGASPSGTMEINQGPTFASFQTDAPREEVFEYLRKGLVDQGWNIDKVDSTSEIAASKGGRRAIVRLDRKSSTTEIGVVLQGG